MLRGFKDFVFRGNLVDLAVAVVIGTAFVALVTAFTTAFIDPLLARVGGASAGDGLGVQLGEEGNSATFMNIGAFLTAVVTFVITAAVVYFAVVVPVAKLTARLRGADPAPTPVPDDVALLTEIRDLLRAERADTGSGTRAGSDPGSTGTAAGPGVPGSGG